MATAAYRTAATAVSPADILLEAFELTHPAAAAPVRCVNDSRPLTLGTDLYAAVRFAVRWPDQSEDRLSRASIAVDNVGRALTQWIQITRGLVGGRMTLMYVRLTPAGVATVEQSVTLDVGGVVIDSQRVRIDLGFGLDLHRPCVGLRFDPSTAPGLFASPVADE